MTANVSKECLLNLLFNGNAVSGQAIELTLYRISSRYIMEPPDHQGHGGASDVTAEQRVIVDAITAAMTVDALVMASA